MTFLSSSRRGLHKDDYEHIHITRSDIRTPSGIGITWEARPPSATEPHMVTRSNFRRNGAHGFFGFRGLHVGSTITRLPLNLRVEVCFITVSTAQASATCFMKGQRLCVQLVTPRVGRSPGRARGAADSEHNQEQKISYLLIVLYVNNFD